MTDQSDDRTTKEGASVLPAPAKREYDSPRLRRLGTVRELTMGSHMTISSDARSGLMTM